MKYNSKFYLIGLLLVALVLVLMAISFNIKHQAMNREEKKEYTAFVNSLKKLLLKNAIVEVTGLEEKDQRFFDAAKLEPMDGAYCDG